MGIYYASSAAVALIFQPIASPFGASLFDSSGQRLTRDSNGAIADGMGALAGLTLCGVGSIIMGVFTTCVYFENN